MWTCLLFQINMKCDYNTNCNIQYVGEDYPILLFVLVMFACFVRFLILMLCCISCILARSSLLERNVNTSMWSCFVCQSKIFTMLSQTFLFYYFLLVMMSIHVLWLFCYYAVLYFMYFNKMALLESSDPLWSGTKKYMFGMSLFRLFQPVFMKAFFLWFTAHKGMRCCRSLKHFN